ncbi:cupin domain-containing protein [Nitratiruptor tergarcus]|uniref:Cupin domain-containing protein n=1 Tax=Nitratiruptor tergarcus DSM 16512 TaxID=1069081 RepID=A0A1W1WRM5_9BACT|nr:cupin domain-containing protein [Nitratiruptor tergarcus]SMC08954.1 Cupin domain-containing protein [Nitratiruptor tergarcus DSM 16512]
MAKVIKTGIRDEKTIKETLQKEGFFNIFTWHDEPHTSYPVHSHPHYEVRWIIDGVLEITQDGKTIRLQPGDRLESEPNTPHSAFTPTGTIYVCASR